MTFKKILLFAVTALLSPALFAQSDYNGDRATSSRYSTSSFQKGWLPGVGLTIGHLEQNGDADSDGTGVDAELMGTYYIPDTFVLADIGVGFHQQYFNNNDETSRNPFLGVITLSGRYQFPYRWSLGPTINTYFGSGDPFGTSANVIPMIGLVGFREVTFPSRQVVRLGLKYVTDVAIANQTINFLGFTAEWAMASDHRFARSTASINASNGY